MGSMYKSNACILIILLSGQTFSDTKLSLVNNNGSSRVLLSSFEFYITGVYKYNKCQLHQNDDTTVGSKVTLHLLFGNHEHFIFWWIISGPKKLTQGSNCDSHSRGNTIPGRVFWFDSVIEISKRKIRHFYLQQCKFPTFTGLKSDIKHRSRNKCSVKIVSIEQVEYHDEIIQLFMEKHGSSYSNAYQIRHIDSYTEAMARSSAVWVGCQFLKGSHYYTFLLFAGSMLNVRIVIIFSFWMLRRTLIIHSHWSAYSIKIGGTSVDDYSTFEKIPLLMETFHFLGMWSPQWWHATSHHAVISGQHWV